MAASPRPASCPDATFLSPQITCFRGDLHKLGVRLGEALLAAMAPHGRKSAAPIREIWPMRLVPGESDGPPPEEARRATSTRRGPGGSG